MSYLLTEIALEMLGYKFYDIDGNLGPTSFQQISMGQQFQSTDLNAESLQSLLGLDEDNGNENAPVDCIRESTVHRAQNGLKKLLDLEYGRLRSQLEQAIHCDTAAFIDYNDANPNEESMNQGYLRRFVLNEREKLEREAQSLQSFRNLVEKNVFTMNQEVFMQYKKVFVSSNKAKLN
ncbi:PREDICTED: uncharacterized protein LOC108369957 [Rhagoletis zephyria]|uniref:uncharacterized protein LOC108369957 n=1 Tax=Rhagoletis zephyria TaxID=28612 RepID=UPI0008112777|nr:PREDICTED: uncharacterized protein LOC108369957 [Rhagoletis zephyria]